MRLTTEDHARHLPHAGCYAANDSTMTEQASRESNDAAALPAGSSIESNNADVPPLDVGERRARTRSLRGKLLRGIPVV